MVNVRVIARLPGVNSLEISIEFWRHAACQVHLEYPTKALFLRETESGIGTVCGESCSRILAYNQNRNISLHLDAISTILLGI